MYIAYTFDQTLIYVLTKNYQHSLEDSQDRKLRHPNTFFMLHIGQVDLKLC